MVFDIQNINYIITGNNQKIINLDLLSGNAKIPGMTFVTDEGVDRMMLSDTKVTAPEDILDNLYYLSSQYRTYRLKKLDSDISSFSASDTDGTIFALFDIKDIAVKSKVAAVEMRNAFQDINNQTFYADNLVDMYNSHMEVDPVGFCQLGPEACGIAVESVKSPAYLQTNLRDTRFDRLVNDQNSLEWFYKIVSKNNDTYTYIPLSNLEKAHLSSDPVSTYINPEGYYFVAKSYKTLSNSIIDEFFVNRYNHLSVENNLIMKLPVHSEDINPKKFNDFNSGIVRGSTYIGKNAYNAEYSMDMKNVENIKHARKYVGLGNVGNRLFLKYYDETNYKAEELEGQQLSTSLSSDVQEIPSRKDEPKTNSYQNIEVFDASNSFAGVSSRHKSNLFSIWVRNTGLNTNNGNPLSEHLNKIQSDITNSIRKIAENLAPAHTQLFKVYFDDSDFG